MEIPEYLDTDLVAAEGLAGDLVFWVTHLLVTMGDLSEETDQYGVPTKASEDMLERLSDAEQPWPIVRVPFSGGHTALAVYANYEDENSVEFGIRHPAWGRIGHLGQCGPEWAGPGLSWSELTTIAADVPEGATAADGLIDPAQRFLLLLPMLGDAATPNEAWSVAAQALADCGMAADAAAEFARDLLGTDEHDRPEKPSWTTTSDSPIPVCSSPSSPRRIPLALGITAEQSQALADALRTAAD